MNVGFLILFLRVICGQLLKSVRSADTKKNVMNSRCVLRCLQTCYGRRCQAMNIF